MTDRAEHNTCVLSRCRTVYHNRTSYRLVFSSRLKARVALLGVEDSGLHEIAKTPVKTVTTYSCSRQEVTTSSTKLVEFVVAAAHTLV